MFNINSVYACHYGIRKKLIKTEVDVVRGKIGGKEKTVGSWLEEKERLSEGKRKKDG